jgi:hypothetical protein
MAVKVTLKNGEESFDHEDDYYLERIRDGALEVHRADKTVKVYAKGFWLAVDGKQLEDDLFDV